MNREVHLRVVEARQRDVGHGKVRIDHKTMQALGISAGDFIEMHGKKVTVAVAWPAYVEDQGQDVIRMDGIVRRNAGVALDEYVTIKAGDVKDAQNIVFAPTDIRLEIDEDFVSFVKRRFMDMPFREGDMTLLSVFERAVPLVVVRGRPHGVIKIAEVTNVQILTEPPPTKECIPVSKYRTLVDLKDAMRSVAKREAR